MLYYRLLLSLFRLRAGRLILTHCHPCDCHLAYVTLARVLALLRFVAAQGSAHPGDAAKAGGAVEVPDSRVRVAGGRGGWAPCLGTTVLYWLEGSGEKKKPNK